MKRLTRASEYCGEEVTAGTKEGTFRIKSEWEMGGFYEVDFNLPSCSCLDFRKSKLACKHFGAVLLLTDGWAFSRLPAAYRDGPYLKSARYVPPFCSLQIWMTRPSCKTATVPLSAKAGHPSA